MSLLEAQGCLLFSREASECNSQKSWTQWTEERVDAQHFMVTKNLMRMLHKSPLVKDTYSGTLSTANILTLSTWTLKHRLPRNLFKVLWALSITDCWFNKISFLNLIWCVSYWALSRYFMNIYHCGAREATFMNMLSQSFPRVIYKKRRQFLEG
jgi:hypothetical protein